MKIRSLLLRGHKSIPDISLSLTREEQISPITIIQGGNGSGKSLALNLLALSWISSIKSSKPSWTFEGDLARIDFEHENEILPVHIRGENVETHPKLKSLFDAQKNEHLVLKYDIQRLLRLPDWSEAGNTGKCAVLPLLSDIHNQGIRNSIVLIDDFGDGLDVEARMTLYRYLRRHYMSSGNQMVMTVRDGWGGGTDALIRVLEHREDPVTHVERLLS